MKRMLKVIVVLLVVISLTACSSQTGATLSPSTVEVSPSALPTVTASAAAVSPSSLSSMLVPDTDIPDVELAAGERAADPRASVFEDDKYIFYADFNLYCISKATGEMSTVSENYSSGFTLYNGKAYYVAFTGTDREKGVRESIMRYDPQSGKAEEVFSVNSMINYMTIYKDMIYITYAADQNDSNSAVGLYAVKLNGGSSKLIRKNVNTFCIYKDTIYYTVPSASGLWDRTALYKCGLDGSGNTRFIDNVYPDIQISNGKLYSSYSDTVTDLDTGASIPVSMTDNDSGFAFLGNYLLYITGNYGERDPRLYAFNVNTGETYYLIDLGGYHAYMLRSVSGSAYVGLGDENGTHLSRVTIKDGMASISEVLYIADDSADEYGDDEYGDDDGDDYEEEDYVDTEPAPLEFKQPKEDTVIIADSKGYIMGGYSGGIWLTHVEAAAYCGKPMMFYQYSFAGRETGVKSLSVRQGESELSPYSGTICSEYGTDPDGGYVLDIASSDAPGYLFSMRPERFPQISKVTGLSQVQQAVQQRVDDNFGKGKVEAQVNEAVSADIDGDGKSEIIFNSGNTQGEDYYFDDIGRDWYSLAGVIEDDGSVNIIQEYYITGYAETSGSIQICSFVDIDGDGVCEFIAEISGYEAWATNVYKYDGKDFTEVLWYETCV